MRPAATSSRNSTRCTRSSSSFAFLLGFVGITYFGWLPLFLPELFPTPRRSTGTGISFNTGRVVAAVVVLSAGFLLDQFAGDYSRVGFWSGMIYALGMLVVWFVPRRRAAGWRTDVDEVGVIGLGLMGRCLLERFRAGKLDVAVVDAREECGERLAEIGGEPVESVASRLPPDADSDPEPAE